MTVSNEDSDASSEALGRVYFVNVGGEDDSPGGAEVALSLEGSNPLFVVNVCSSIASEMSSIGAGSATEWEHDAAPSVPRLVQEITRNAMISSQQRRAQRRQWNPSCQQEPSFPKVASIVVPTPEVLALDDVDHDHFCHNDDMKDEALSRNSEPYEKESSNEEAVGCHDESPHAQEEDPEEQADHQGASNFGHGAAPDSKYDTYACMVDATQNDRSVEIHLYSMARPHMRAFHFAWMAFFVAFFTWFAITPLLSEVQRSLDLTTKQIWMSSVFAVAGSAVTRILIGPLCDKFGSRWAMAGTLILSAIPTALTGLVQTAAGLNALRLVIGVAGSAFVTCQYWTSSMFIVEVAGTANALVAGWGNLGGGVTQLVMGSLLFPLFKVVYGGTYEENDDDFDRASDLAWRTVCVIPAIFCAITSYLVVRYSDDCPKGNYNKRTRQGHSPQVSAVKALRDAVSTPNTWILFVQYACCFGVEITMVNAAALYFHDIFNQSTESAAAIASIFGWMNLLARGVGGYVSDMVNAKYGMRGRLWLQVATLVCEGVMVVVFGRTNTLGGAIAAMIVLSIFVQAAEGSTFAIVPYVKHSITGSIAGVVGAGGNVGGVVFALIFGNFDYQKGFLFMGVIALSSAILSLLVVIRGHASLIFGTDCDNVRQRRCQHSEAFGSLPRVSTSVDNRDVVRGPPPEGMSQRSDKSSSSSGNNSTTRTLPVYFRFGEVTAL